MEWQDWIRFVQESASPGWIYFVQFGTTIFAWGTASGKGERLRKSSIFDEKLTGKYDRRVDYLMLKIIEGKPLGV